MLKEKFIGFIEYLQKNKGRSIGTLLGFIISILFLTIGFFRTLLIILCTSIGYYLGDKVDNRENLKEILRKIFPPNRDR